MTHLRIFSAGTPARADLTCRAIHSVVTPVSRCSRDSPTQMMGLMPASSTARTFLLTMESVSPKYCRRSLWPTMTYFTPRSLSMSAETSPVKAPLFS